MSKTTHTPGPWEVLIDTRGFDIHQYDDCKGYRSIIAIEPILANANLISAAPDLLEALQALSARPDVYCFCRTVDQSMNGHTGECQDAQVAIAKATGTL